MAIDLTTRYLGLTLKCPVIAGAGPVTGTLDGIRRLADLGAGAVVLPSLFEEQIEREQQMLDRLATTGAESYAEALTYFPAQARIMASVPRAISRLLLGKASAAVDIPVVASLNGITDHGWVEYARQIEEAGASALELNIYFIPTDADMRGTEVEDRYLQHSLSRREARRCGFQSQSSWALTSSAMGHMAAPTRGPPAPTGWCCSTGSTNPDIDLAQPSRCCRRIWISSTPVEIRLPLLWIGVRFGVIGRLARREHWCERPG